jgi:hypothetical protein
MSDEKPEELWNEDDYQRNFDHAAETGRKNIEIANAIARAMKQRFGRGPQRVRIAEEDK